jgi:hypothetical protein
MAALLCDNEWIDVDLEYISGVDIVDYSQLKGGIEVSLEQDGFCVVDIGEASSSILKDAQNEAVAFFDASETTKQATQLLIHESGISSLRI